MSHDSNGMDHEKLGDRTTRRKHAESVSSYGDCGRSTTSSYPCGSIAWAALILLLEACGILLVVRVLPGKAGGILEYLVGRLLIDRVARLPLDRFPHRILAVKQSHFGLLVGQMVLEPSEALHVVSLGLEGFGQRASARAVAMSLST